MSNLGIIWSIFCQKMAVFNRFGPFFALLIQHDVCKQLHSHAFLKQLLIMKLVQKSLHLDGLSKYSSLFFIAFILWAICRGQNPLNTRYMASLSALNDLKANTIEFSTIKKEWEIINSLKLNSVYKYLHFYSNIVIDILVLFSNDPKVCLS